MRILTAIGKRREPLLNIGKVMGKQLHARMITTNVMTFKMRRWRKSYDPDHCFKNVKDTGAKHVGKTW